MFSRLIRLIVAISFLLCISGCVASAWFHDHKMLFEKVPFLPNYRINLGDDIDIFYSAAAANAPASEERSRTQDERWIFGHRFMQEEHATDTPDQPLLTQQLSIPYWWVIVPTALLPLASRALRRQRRCPQCGYRLNSGTPPPRKKSTAGSPSPYFPEPQAESIVEDQPPAIDQPESGDDAAMIHEPSLAAPPETPTDPPAEMPAH